MTLTREIRTEGNPIKALSNFLKAAWSDLALEAMLVPLQNPETGDWEVRITENPDDLSRANLIVPILTENCASRIQMMIQDFPGLKVGSFLRPCELEAWKKIRPSQEPDQNLFTFSIDCLGTYPLGDFSWRSARKGAEDNFFKDYLRFSQIGGISPYRMRIACQLCENPVPQTADMNFHFIGLPVEEIILISISERIKSQLQTFERLIEPSSKILDAHQNVSEKLIQRNRQTRERLASEITADIDLELDAIVEQFSTCEDCQTCMASCPICISRGITPGKKLTRQEVAEWMVSCVGCGICEDQCQTHDPLVKVFAILNEKLGKIN